MTVYVDTSALYAVIVAGDADHEAAAAQFAALVHAREHLLTSSYVLVETTALLQSRVGLGAVRTLDDRLLPVLDIAGVDRELHTTAVAALLAAGRRDVSLVDRVGFTLMRRQGTDVAFAFDDDFRREGFAVVP